MNVSLGKSITGIFGTDKKPQVEDGSQSRSGTDSSVLKQPLTFSPQRKAVLLGALLFVLVVWTFLPSIRNGFSSYDDTEYVTNNNHVQGGLTWDGLVWAFRTTTASNWHPLTWLSHMLDCQLFGLQPWGHHLTSVLIHAASTLLLFLTLKGMTGAFWRSLFVAALFGLHPLRVESVAWIAERKDVLSVLFWMLTLWAYARFAEQSKIQRPKSKVLYGLALTFFVLGLLSKPMLVTLPFTLLLLDYWPLERWKNQSVWRLVAEKTPFFMAAAVASTITFLVQKHSGAVQVNLPLAGRLENAVVSYCRYMGKLFWPVDLATPYPLPAHWPLAALIFSGVVLTGISVSVVVRWRKQPYLPAGWLWFVGILVPVIGLVQVGDQAIADRYTYVPLIGILIILAWTTDEWTKSWRHRAEVLSSFSAVAVVFCMVLTRQQIGYWRNGETLFCHAIEVTRDNYIAHTGLGVALHERGLYDEAIEQHLEALRLRPGQALAHYNLAITLDKKGLFDEAIGEFQEALKWKPASAAKVHINLGLTLSKKGFVDEAMGQFQEAIRLRPDLIEPYYNMGFVLSKEERFEEAIVYFQQVLKLKPNHPEAHNYLGVALGRTGHLDEAISHLQEAVKQDPNSADARYNLANALVRKGRLDEAIIQFQETLRLDSGSADAHNNLGVVLSRRGRWEESIIHFQEAIRLKPGYSEAHTNLAAALRMKDALVK